jgi:hypothetical protein
MSLDPLAAWQAYKNQPQQVNSSDNSYNYNTYEKPSYYGATTPPPVVTARDVLAQRDSIPQGPPPSSVQEKSILDSPIPTAEKIGVGVAASSVAKSIYSGIKPTYSAGTNAFRADTSQTISDLQNAKDKGLTSLDLYDSKGNKISGLGLTDTKGNKITGIINPQDIVRARFDILNASLATGGPVSAKGSITTSFTKTTSTSEPDYYRENDSFFKSLGAGIAGTLGYVGLSAMSIPGVVSKFAKGNYDTQAEQQKISQTIQKSVGPTYLDQLLQGNYKSPNLTPEEKAGSLIGSGVGLYLLGGGGGARAIGSKIVTSLKEIPGYLRDLPKGIATNEDVVSKIASGLKEGSIIQNVGPRELVSGIEEKGVPIREITQGTVGKSGIDSFKLEKAPPFIERTGPRDILKTIEPITGQGIEEFAPVKPGEGLAKTITPGLPKNLHETTNIIGIGKVGEQSSIKIPELIVNEGVVYHGTTSDIAKIISGNKGFDFNKIGSSTSIRYKNTDIAKTFGETNKVINLTPNADIAKSYTPAGYRSHALGIPFKTALAGSRDQGENILGIRLKKGTSLLDASSPEFGPKYLGKSFSQSNKADYFAALKQFAKEKGFEGYVSGPFGEPGSKNEIGLFSNNPIESIKTLNPKNLGSNDLNANLFQTSTKQITKPVYGPKTYTKPTEITLEPGLEGEAKNPYALINPKGATAIVRSTPNDVLPPDKLLVEFQGILPEEAAGQAVHYGLEEVPGMKNVYFGKATPHNVGMLEEGVKAGKIKLGTDIFQYGSKEFARHPKIYGEVTRNPELFKSKAFGKGGAFESVTRPSVLRYLIGRDATEVKAPKIGPNSLVRNKNVRPMTGGEFGIGDVGTGKVGAGAAGRAINLLKNTETIAKDFGKVATNQGSKRRYDSLGVILTPEEKQSRRRGSSRNDLEFETIRYPNILSVDQIGRIRTKGRQLSSLQSDIGLLQVNEMIGQTQSNSLLNLTKLGITTKTKTKTDLDTITIPKLDFGTGLTTKQTTRQTTDLITIPGQVPKRPPPTTKQPPPQKILLGGLYFGIPGYPSGNKRKRNYRSRATFFTYSVNPNVVGAIAEAGQPGKIVSNAPIRFKGFGKVKGPNLKNIGKGIGLGGGKRGVYGRKGKKGNLDNMINLRF